MEDVALDMFLKGLLVVEGGTAEPRDAAPAQLQWDDSARCYLPDMYNAEVSQGLLGQGNRAPLNAAMCSSELYKELCIEQ